jgi:hypothetical protein
MRMAWYFGPNTAKRKGVGPARVSPDRRYTQAVSHEPIAIEDFLGIAGARVEIVERSATPSPILDRLARLAPWLTVIRAQGSDEAPTVRVVGSGRHGEITFVGPLEGRLLEPFVQLLRALATGEVDYDTPATPARLAELDKNVAVSVAVGSRCPYCPAVAAAALRLACGSPRVDVVIARADLGLAGDVRAVPTIMVDGAARRSGPTSEWELVELVML